MTGAEGRCFDVRRISPPTLAVRPPRSGLFKIASRVLRKRGSDFDIQVRVNLHQRHPRPTHSRGKEYERHDENSGIQDVDFVVTLSEELLLRVPCLLHYLLVQLIARLQPLIAPRTRERAFVREAEA